MLLIAGIGIHSVFAEPPPLLTEPQILNWRGGEMDCSHFQIIAPDGAAFAVGKFKRAFAGSKEDPAVTKITFRLAAVAHTNSEPYMLDTDTNGIVIIAPEHAGLL